MNYNIVPMARHHINEIVALEKASFSAPWSHAMLEEELFNPQASFLVAVDDDGAVVGYTGLHVVLDEGYIANVAVNDKYRRMGIAGEILDVYCRFGETNLAFLTLEVRPSNKAAIALYFSRDFEQVGRRKDYYNHPTEDAIIMTRFFKPEAEVEVDA